MADEDDFGQAGPLGKDKRRVHPQRTWTKRVDGKLLFRRYTARDAAGNMRIWFAVEPINSDGKWPPGVFEVFKAHQKREEDGKPTGLRFSRDPVHGDTFSITDHRFGRALADRIDQILLALGSRLDRERGPER
jgi:hypothetical protein